MGPKSTFQISILILFSVLCLLLLSCDNSDSGAGPEDPIVINPPAITPGMIDSANFPDEEAGMMALWYCDELIPSGDVYVRFRDALKELRREYCCTTPEVKIRFVFPSTVSQILIGLTDSAKAEYRNGTYHAWDSLNALFQLKSIDTSMFAGIFSTARLTFKGKLHPVHLALYYKNLPGVEYAEARAFGGDWSNLYPWILDDKVTFLARDAWGDCPSGCIESHFFYFKETDTGFAFIGDWSFWTPVPDWWEEGRTAFCAYRSHGSCD